VKRDAVECPLGSDDSVVFEEKMSKSQAPSPLFTREAPVRLTVYDIRGRLIKSLIAESQSSGLYTIEWHGDDSFGLPVPAGIYLYRLDAGPWSATRKTVLVR